LAIAHLSGVCGLNGLLPKVNFLPLGVKSDIIISIFNVTGWMQQGVVIS